MTAQHAEMVDDATLAQACKSGDLAAFETLVQRHQRMLLNVAYRMTGVYEDACDIVQDSFLAAWQKMGDFRGDAKLSTWLTAIVINHSRNRRQQTRQRERREPYSLDAPIPGGDGGRLPDPPCGSPSALDRLEEAELRTFLRRCIDALTPEFREVLVLRDMQELSYDEVAGALKLREGTVKSRLFRARDAVKECLKKAVGNQ
jgi:RNA polymerase sigma-70 factor (ECF subfamily)